jgi:hypothetical protein
MKKFDITIDGETQHGVIASHPRLAIAKVILDRSRRMKGEIGDTLKAGETMTVTVARVPYTKADVEARKAETERWREQQSARQRF